MPYTTPFQRQVTVVNAGGNVNSTVLHDLGNPDVGILPVNIRCPSNLQGVATVKVQVGYTDQGVTTFFDVLDTNGAVVPLTCAASGVIPIYDVVQQDTLGFDSMRLVANTNPAADIVFFIEFTAAQDDNPVVASAIAIASGQTITAALQTVASDTVTQVASSASNVTLKASNTARKGLAIYNDSTQILYVKMGVTASNTSYTVQIPSQGYWEMPIAGGIYTGEVDGIWAAANGNAYVTEW